MPELPTIDIAGLEIFAAGDWNGDKYSEQDLDGMVQAFDKVGFKPTVKAGHADGQEHEQEARRIFGAPALGYVTRLYRRGTKLLADIAKVPRRFAALIKAGAYSRVSSEVYWNYANHDGNRYHRVLKSVAFLGAEVPALTNLQEIEALYARNDTGSLYAYDAHKNEFHVYETDASAPKPILNRYKEEGLFIIKKEADGYCVYDPKGEKVKTWPTLDAAKASLEGYNSKVEEGSSQDESYDKKKRGYAMEIHENDEGQFCVTGDDGKEKCFATKEEAEKHVASPEPAADRFPAKLSNKKGGHMTEQEVDAKIQEAVERALAAQGKEYEKQMDYRVHKAREDAKAEAEKDAATLREEIRKLEATKRSERIEGWLKRMKAEGKIPPAEESKIRTLREWIPDEAEGLKYFSLKGGKTEEHSANPAELFESLFENRTSAFQTYSRAGGPSDEIPVSDGNDLEDAGAEVDRRAKVYQDNQKAKNSPVEYTKAVGVVLKQDPDLARRYHNMDRH
jgi:hypothetical protein